MAKNLTRMAEERDHQGQPAFKDHIVQTNVFPMGKRVDIPKNVASTPQMISAKFDGIQNKFNYTPIMPQHVSNLSQNEVFKLNK